jgi:hypothetical protein
VCRRRAPFEPAIPPSDVVQCCNRVAFETGRVGRTASAGRGRWRGSLQHCGYGRRQRWRGDTGRRFGVMWCKQRRSRTRYLGGHAHKAALPIPCHVPGLLHSDCSAPRVWHAAAPSGHAQTFILMGTASNSMLKRISLLGQMSGTRRNCRSILYNTLQQYLERVQNRV